MLARGRQNNSTAAFSGKTRSGVERNAWRPALYSAVIMPSARNGHARYTHAARITPVRKAAPLPPCRGMLPVSGMSISVHRPRTPAALLCGSWRVLYKHNFAFPLSIHASGASSYSSRSPRYLSLPLFLGALACHMFAWRIFLSQRADIRSFLGWLPARMFVMSLLISREFCATGAVSS